MKRGSVVKGWQSLGPKGIGRQLAPSAELALFRPQGLYLGAGVQLGAWQPLVPEAISR